MSREKKQTPRGSEIRGALSKLTTVLLEQELESEARGDGTLERVVLQELRIDRNALGGDQRLQRLPTGVEQRFVRRNAVGLLIGRRLARRRVLVEQVEHVE